jgi:hypothetical protein
MPKKDDIYKYNNEKFIFINKYYEQNINGSLDVSVVIDKLNCDERYAFKEDFFNEHFVKVEGTKKEKITGIINDIANTITGSAFSILILSIIMVGLYDELLREKNVCENVQNVIMKK